ncbi:MAG: hypothetical protein ACI4DX_04940 [Oliverpabstia sp.]
MQKVLFIGGFAYGKRTLVNTILRKQVLNTSVVPGIDSQISRFVNEIVSGDSERCFSVNKDGNKELLNLDDLRRAMTDDFELKPLLRDPEYIVHECPAQANNLTFTIANPCMQEYGYKHGQYGREILSNPRWENDAVVYVLNAAMLLAQDDRRYIERYLSDGPNSNLFFCINRMDTIMEKYVSEIKNFTKEILRRVFTTNGVFDEALYQSRVFFISAYHSLNARLGKPSHTFSGDVYVKDVDTGVPEFEYTLRKFLQQQSIEKKQR